MNLVNSTDRAGQEGSVAESNLRALLGRSKFGKKKAGAPAMGTCRHNAGQSGGMEKGSPKAPTTPTTTLLHSKLSSSTSTVVSKSSEKEGLSENATKLSWLWEEPVQWLPLGVVEGPGLSVSV
jgi:hypothetical protein